MRRLALLLALLAAPAWADTVIFTETCASNPSVALASSTTVTVGTAWSAKINFVGASANTFNSGTANCSVNTGSSNVGFGNTATPVPTTDIYYVDFQWIDGGNIAATDCVGMVVNYIDTSNYYACAMCDDATTGVTKIIKVTGGVGSALASGTFGTVPTNDIVECKLDYTSSNPTITLTNTTDALQFLTATDSSSPLTKTKKAGVVCGATPQATGDDCNGTTDIDTVRVVEVAASATRGAIVVQ